MFSNTYLKPGPYFKITDVPAPLVAGGDFIPLMIGLGRKELDVFDVLSRSVGVDTKDLITDSNIVAAILDLIDENQIQYTQGVDYNLVRGTGVDAEKYYVDWNIPQTITGTEALTGPLVLTAKTLKLNVKNAVGAFQGTITFTASETDIATIVSKINTDSGLTIASDSGAGDLLVLTGDLIIIEGGSALSDLGFINGQKVESKEPAEGINYTVYYKRIKNSTEYKQMLFTKLEDVYADQGAPIVQKVLLTQTTGAGITIAPVTDNTKLSQITDTNADFTNIPAGSYIKLTSGTGAGQIRIVCEVVDATNIIVNNFNEDPDISTKYVITDIGQNQTSFGCFFANKGGSQQFIVSQTQDDIVDDNNWRKAIDATKEDVQGKQAFHLVPLMAVDVNESIVSYVKSYLAELNSTTGNKERTATFGIKTGMTASDVIQLLNGIGDETIGVATNPYIKNGSDTFGSEYLAAYEAGIDCNPDYDEGEPISGKIVALDYIDDPWITYEKRLFGQNGGIVVEKQGVDYKIVHWLSTNQTDIIKAERKVFKQKAGLKKSLRGILQTAIVNTRAIAIAVPRADSIVRMILDDKKNKTAINDYKNLSVAFDVTDPRQLNVSFLFKPTFDINWVLVTFGATIS